MEWNRGQFTISTDRARLDREAIHAFLQTSYWAPEISREIVDRSIENSLCFGVYEAEPAGRIRAGRERLRDLRLPGGRLRDPVPPRARALEVARRNHPGASGSAEPAPLEPRHARRPQPLRALRLPAAGASRASHGDRRGPRPLPAFEPEGDAHDERASRLVERILRRPDGGLLAGGHPAGGDGRPRRRSSRRRSASLPGPACSTCRAGTAGTRSSSRAAAIASRESISRRTSSAPRAPPRRGRAPPSSGCRATCAISPGRACSTAPTAPATPSGTSTTPATRRSSRRSRGRSGPGDGSSSSRDGSPRACCRSSATSST